MQAGDGDDKAMDTNKPQRDGRKATGVHRFILIAHNGDLTHQPAAEVRSNRHTSPGLHADSGRCVKSCVLNSACSAEMVTALPAARNRASR